MQKIIFVIQEQLKVKGVVFNYLSLIKFYRVVPIKGTQYILDVPADILPALIRLL